MRLLDLPFVERPRTSAPSRRACRRRRPRRPGPSTTRPRRPRWPCPSTSVTWGTRSFIPAGARLVHRSCRSVRCVSASMTLTWSSGGVMPVPFVWRRLQQRRGHWFSGKPRLTPPWLGSSQRLVTTFASREEVHPVGAVGVGVAEERVLPPSERVVGDRHRDRDVDADHPDLDLVLEPPGGAAVVGEDRRRRSRTGWR